MSKYTYYIDFGTGDVQVIPDKDPVFSWENEGSNDGFKRRKIKEFLLTRDYIDSGGAFTNALAFNTLWEWYFDTTKHSSDLKLSIYKNAVLDFEMVFKILDGTIDVNGGTYLVKPATDDPYRIFLAVADDEVDVITPYTPSRKAILTDTTVTEGEDSGDPFTPPDDSGTWIRGYGSGNTWWYRERSQYFIDYTGTKIGDYWYYPVLTPPLATTPPYGTGITTIWEFPNCRYLTDIIQYILDTTLADTDIAGMQFVSHFFNDPVNYVTGEVNKLMNTLIEQRSDTKDPDASNKATIGTISFNDLMDELSKMFDVRWFIDDDGNLRIEHEKFFVSGLTVGGTKALGIDLTNYSKYKDRSSGKLYIEDSQTFIGAEVTKVIKETIKFQDQESIDFRSDKFYIQYSDVSEGDSIKEHAMTFISTDVSMAINDPDSIQDDGFFLFNCEAEVVDSLAIITRPKDHTEAVPYNIGNAAFGVKWLLHDYYGYGRQDKSGTLYMPAGNTTGGSTYVVLNTVPMFTQKDIVFLLNDEDEIDINKYIATLLTKSDGTNHVINGNIIKITHDLSDDFVKATLGFEL